MVDTGETADKDELFGKMKMDDMDLAELDDAFAAKDDTALMLPGLSIWNATADDCPQTVGPDVAKDVTITLKKAKAFEHEGKLLINRVACKVVNWDKEGMKLELEADPELKFDNIGAAKEYFEKAAAGAATGTVPEKKPEDPKADANAENADAADAANNEG